MEEKKYTTYELIEDQKGNLNIAIFLEDAYTLEEQAYIKNIEPERFIDMENDIENWRSWREWKKAKNDGLTEYYEEQDCLGKGSTVLAYSFVDAEGEIRSIKDYYNLSEKGLRAFRIFK